MSASSSRRKQIAEISLSAPCQRPTLEFWEASQMQDPSKNFDGAMFDIYRRAKSEAGYNATTFLQMLSNRGGLDTAKYLINSPKQSVGYAALCYEGVLISPLRRWSSRMPSGTGFSPAKNWEEPACASKTTVTRRPAATNRQRRGSARKATRAEIASRVFSRPRRAVLDLSKVANFPPKVASSVLHARRVRRSTLRNGGRVASAAVLSDIF
jgi:hypothetical protein